MFSDLSKKKCFLIPFNEKNVLNVPWSILNSKNIDGEKEKLYFGPILDLMSLAFTTRTFNLSIKIIYTTNYVTVHILFKYPLKFLNSFKQLNNILTKNTIKPFI